MSAATPKSPAPRTNGWIVIPINGDIEAKIGQQFDVRAGDGAEAYGLTYGTPCTYRWSDGSRGAYHATHGPNFTCNLYDGPEDTVAYRLHDPEDAEEQIRRAERLERFNEIARRAPLDMPRPEPEPAPFRRREPVNPPCGHRPGLQPVSGAVARQMRRIAREARDHWSRHLATDMTPAERAEAHAFIRELTRIIDGGPL